jgi:UDP-2,4-diacetamido-2,4,6-trideoxy-beta-L-altropyranose hydrolase
MKNSIIVFRVDGGPTPGIGHLRRCLTLAAELRKHEFRPHFVVRDRLAPALALLVSRYELHYLADADDRNCSRGEANDELWDADRTLAIIGQLPMAVRWVVLDSYGLGYKWEKRVRGTNHLVAVIDDYRNRRHHADLLVSDSDEPFASGLNDIADRGANLTGRKYALLEPEYAFTLENRKAQSVPKRVLVSYGGADPTSETLKALDAFRAIRADRNLNGRIGRIDVVIGLVDPKASDIIRAAAGIGDITVHRDVLSLGPLMRKADLVLTTGGNSMIEALALRKPCIVTVVSDNHATIVAEFCAQSAIRSLGVHSMVKATDVQETVTDILANFDEFAAWVASNPLFDHLGASRIASVMLAKCAAQQL